MVSSVIYTFGSSLTHFLLAYHTPTLSDTHEWIYVPSVVFFVLGFALITFWFSAYRTVTQIRHYEEMEDEMMHVVTGKGDETEAQPVDVYSPFINSYLDVHPLYSDQVVKNMLEVQQNPPPAAVTNGLAVGTNAQVTAGPNTPVQETETHDTNVQETRVHDTDEHDTQAHDTDEHVTDGPETGGDQSVQAQPVMSRPVPLEPPDAPSSPPAEFLSHAVADAHPLMLHPFYYYTERKFAPRPPWKKLDELFLNRPDSKSIVIDRAKQYVAEQIGVGSDTLSTDDDLNSQFDQIVFGHTNDNRVVLYAENENDPPRRRNGRKCIQIKFLSQPDNNQSDAGNQTRNEMSSFPSDKANNPDAPGGGTQLLSNNDKARNEIGMQNIPSAPQAILDALSSHAAIMGYAHKPCVLGIPKDENEYQFPEFHPQKREKWEDDEKEESGYVDLDDLVVEFMDPATLRRKVGFLTNQIDTIKRCLDLASYQRYS